MTPACRLLRFSKLEVSFGTEDFIMEPATERKLKIEFDAHQFQLSEAEEQRLRDSADGLARQVENFPFADLHVMLEHNARSNDITVKLSLFLPGTTLVTTERDLGAVTAFERGLDSLINNLKAYKDQLGDVSERQKAEKGTQQELHTNVPIDAAAIDAAVAADDYTAFRTATFAYEEDLGKLVGRWIQRYPELDAQLGDRMQIADLVEEVFLFAFKSYSSRPPAIAFGPWLQGLIDPALKAIQRHPDEELEAIGLVRTAVEAEQEADRPGS
jgi:ribosome-associated translation inhibitor RaiA